MASRLELQTFLEGLIESRNVYFDPPESVKMRYPAIRFSKAKVQNIRANNSVYKQHTAYDVTVMYFDPDSDISDRVSKLPMCSFDRHYVVDNLHHDTYRLYW